jgi:hypothetical protein
MAGERIVWIDAEDAQLAQDAESPKFMRVHRREVVPVGEMAPVQQYRDQRVPP